MVPGIERSWPLSISPVNFSPSDFRPYGRTYLFGYFILKIEDIGNPAIVTFCPNLNLGDRITQLDRDTNTLTSAPHTTLQ